MRDSATLALLLLETQRDLKGEFYRAKGGNLKRSLVNILFGRDFPLGWGFWKWWGWWEWVLGEESSD